MKQIIFAAALCFTTVAQAQVGIGTASPNASAQLDISSADKGILIPRLTTAEVAAIISPATGLLVFQTDNGVGFYFYNGATWTPLHSGILSIENGGTGSSSQNFVDISTDQSVAGTKTFSNDIKVNTEISVGKGTSSGSQNTVLGNQAESGTTGNNNTALGFFTLNSITTGNDNTTVGTNAMRFTTAGDYNTALGATAAQFTLGSGNTAIGHTALGNNTSGSFNTALGYQANVLSDNLTNTTAVGNGATVATDNTIQLGNADVTSVKTSGQLTSGTITYPNTAGTSGQVLTTNGSNTASWATPSSSGSSGLLQSVTTTERDALGITSAGFMLFNTTTNTFQGTQTILSPYNNVTTTIYGEARCKDAYYITQSFTAAGQTVSSATLSVYQVISAGSFHFALIDNEWDYVVSEADFSVSGADANSTVNIPLSSWMGPGVELWGSNYSIKITSNGGDVKFLLNATSGIGTYYNSYDFATFGQGDDNGHNVSCTLNLAVTGVKWVNLN